MYGVAVEAGVGFLGQYGLVVLLVVFALEGALVGKLMPTRALFVAAALAIGTTVVGLASVFAVAVAGATAGQLLLFALVRYTDLAPAWVSVPGAGAGDGDTGARLAGWFDRWGLSAVALSNALPVARGSLTVPVAMTDECAVRFSASSLVGTAAYAGGLLAVAAGLDAALVLV